MNMNQLTQKSLAAIQGAQSLAQQYGQQQYGQNQYGQQGYSQGQQGDSRRVFVQPRCLFKRRDLICRQQGGEMRIRQNRSQG